jgi:hypothetical protein
MRRPDENRSSAGSEGADDHARRVALQLGRNVEAAIGERSLAEVARLVDLPEALLRDIILGAANPNVTAIQKLESRLRVALWPPHGPSEV